ncbi:SAM-dependent methyltransferase [Lysobacter sp. TY2-98]|uniref:SAM-dependent methyltransferase n=1 Tax=Lysobacter sp. TY2-98 TaxID=2290922 RepID=UPI0019652113|nr:SAM-dependent methyltransferase [Lysobacter sp. TY2-98]
MEQSRPGYLACVGLGMMLGAHLTPRSRNTIEQADVVFVLASDGLVERWVEEMHPDVRSLQPYYAEGKNRRTTYEEMVGAILAEVRAGRRVCAAFYGHPGVFAQVAHDAIAVARSEGFDAEMQPGISAEDCLYADLGIDPGRFGCQHFEATQFLCCDRPVDTAGYVVLWQVALAGDRSFTRYSTTSAYRNLLVEKLSTFYPAQHEVIVYEAPTIATHQPRMDRMPVNALASAELHMHSTLVIGPARRLAPDQKMLAALEAIENGSRTGRRGRPTLVVVKDDTRMEEAQ